MTSAEKTIAPFSMKLLTSSDTQRILFWLVLIASGGIFWLSPHPPMIDIPQHAGQVALILDLLSHNPHWHNTFYLNYFTPYLLGYGLWALLATLMPVAIALKVLLSITFYGFVFAAQHLRHRCQADDRLDWLLIPSFFGFCFNWGFLTFLMAAPFGIIFITQAMNHTEVVKPRDLIYFFLGGLFLFFCHGLVFLMCMAIGGLLALTQNHSLKNLSLRLAPYIALAPVVALYFLSTKNNATTAQFNYELNTLWLLNTDRLLQFITLPWGSTYSLSVTSQIGMVALFSPILIGCRLNRNIKAWLPLFIVIIIWVAVPHFAMKTFFLYERFSLFILPFYMLIFIKDRNNYSINKTAAPIRIIIPWILPVLVSTFAIVSAIKTLDFARESSDFDRATKNIPNGKRIAALIYDRKSLALENPATYTHYASWYQAEHKGIVDFSFAWFSPQPVRFKENTLPSIKPGLEWSPEQFNWEQQHGEYYDYFFIRGNIPDESALLNNKSCSLRHFSSYGHWHVYQKILCKTPSIETHNENA